MSRRRPGEVRDAIVNVLEGRPNGASVQEIGSDVTRLIGDVSASSVRSYLRLNTPELFARVDRAQYVLAGMAPEVETTGAAVTTGEVPAFDTRHGRMFQEDCLSWLERQAKNSVHAVVTDPPYGLVEYSDAEQIKLRQGRGGVWRIPPSFVTTKPYIP